MPKQTRKSSELATGSVTARDDVEWPGRDRIVNGDVDFFPPPPPDDEEDVGLPPPERDSLPPPPPSILQHCSNGVAGVVRGAGQRRHNDYSNYNMESPSSSSSSDSVTSELAAAMLAARLRAESSQPPATAGLLNVHLRVCLLIHTQSK